MQLWLFCNISLEAILYFVNNRTLLCIHQIQQCHLPMDFENKSLGLHSSGMPLGFSLPNIYLYTYTTKIKENKDVGKEKKVQCVHYVEDEFIFE